MAKSTKWMASARVARLVLVSVAGLVKESVLMASGWYAPSNQGLRLQSAVTHSTTIVTAVSMRPLIYASPVPWALGNVRCRVRWLVAQMVSTLSARAIPVCQRSSSAMVSITTVMVPLMRIILRAGAIVIRGSSAFAREAYAIAGMPLLLAIASTSRSMSAAMDWMMTVMVRPMKISTLAKPAPMVSALVERRASPYVTTLRTAWRAVRKRTSHNRSVVMTKTTIATI